MDASEVKAAASDHAQGVLAGDLRRAGGYLAPEAQAGAGEVMKRLPHPVSGAEVTSVTAQEKDWRVVIRYSGGSAEAEVTSLWAERDGRPLIVGFTEDG